MGGAWTQKKNNRQMKEVKENIKKISSYYHLFNRWLLLRQNGKSCVDYFEKNQYKTIAIYGMKEFGERLFDELRNTDIKVKYVIDKNVENLYANIIYANDKYDGLRVVSPEEELQEVDVIVVTANFYFDEIIESLYEKIDVPVVSLEEVLSEVESAGGYGN